MGLLRRPHIQRKEEGMRKGAREQALAPKEWSHGSRDCRETLQTYRDRKKIKRRGEEGGKRASSRPQGVVPRT